MEFLIGVTLALVIGLAMTFIGLDRDRACYPIVMIVIAAYYVLFAVIGAVGGVLLPETMLALLFVAAAIAGFRYSLWITVVALGAHGVFDFFHEHILADPGVPLWWPNFCLAYDVIAAAYLALRLSWQRLSTARALYENSGAAREDSGSQPNSFVKEPGARIS